MADLAMIDAFVAISQVNARFCRALDARDWAAFAALLTEDFVLDVGEDNQAIATIAGRDAALAAVGQELQDATIAHQIHVPEINLRGDEASVIAAMQDEVVWAEPKNGVVSLNGYGQYHQRFVRANGAWKLAALKLTRFHVDVQRAASNTGQHSR